MVSICPSSFQALLGQTDRQLIITQLTRKGPARAGNDRTRGASMGQGRGTGGEGSSGVGDTGKEGSSGGKLDECIMHQVHTSIYELA